MQIVSTPTLSTRKQLCKVIFYSTPEGNLVAVLGNTHVQVTPEEATQCFHNLLESTKLYRMLLPSAPHSHNGAVHS